VATLDAPHQASAQAPAAAPAGAAPGPEPASAGKRRPALRAVIASEALILLFIAGFLVYLFGLSSVAEARSQVELLARFQGELGQLTAPTGPAAEGSPVAVLNVPQIGLRNVVVIEGTTSRDLSHGPGLVRASALPGQAGVSVIYGKAVTYGAPFAHLMQLNRGDLIGVTTGQGTARYVVESFGTSTRPAPADAPSRLVLETAGPGLVPHDAVQVSADLLGAAKPNPGGQPVISPEEIDMAWNPDSLIPLMLWVQALLIVVVVATVAANRWSRAATYLCAGPVVAALLWCVYENLAAVLPNLY
jgi:sortase A